MEGSGRNLEGFSLLFGISEAVGAIVVILVTIWMGNFRGGFAWTSDPKTQFNWHPVLMTLAMVFLYANGKCIFFLL
jgi:cytochrome b-561